MEGLTPSQRAALVSSFSNLNDAQRLLRVAGFPAGKIPQTAADAAGFWFDVSELLEKGTMADGVRRVLKAAAEHFPYNPAFQAPASPGPVLPPPSPAAGPSPAPVPVPAPVPAQEPVSAPAGRPAEDVPQPAARPEPDPRPPARPPAPVPEPGEFDAAKSSRATVIAAVVGGLGAVAAAVIAGVFALLAGGGDDDAATPPTTTTAATTSRPAPDLLDELSNRTVVGTVLNGDGSSFTLTIDFVRDAGSLGPDATLGHTDYDITLATGGEIGCGTDVFLGSQGSRAADEVRLFDRAGALACPYLYELRISRGDGQLRFETWATEGEQPVGVVATPGLVTRGTLDFAAP